LFVDEPWLQPSALVEQGERSTMPLNFEIVLTSADAKKAEVYKQELADIPQLEVSTRRSNVANDNRRYSC
jgi:hypothetical protein